jgi:hypothetical protein
MRTTITLSEKTHEFATYYARARGLTLSAAIDELIGKAQNPTAPEIEIRRSPNGLPLLPRSGRTLTTEMVKQLSEDEFVPNMFRHSASYRSAASLVPKRSGKTKGSNSQ